MSNDSESIQAAASEPSRQANPRTAPWFNVPRKAIVSVEHVCIIKDVDKAIETLGGTTKVQRLVGNEGRTTVAQLYLHPGDRMSNPILSNNVSTHNILLRVTVPKRTGRKRKRGSLEPYQDAPEVPDRTISTTRDTHNLLDFTSANVGRYHIRPVGLIEQTHRFRDLPDFVWSTANSPFMQKMRDHIYPLNYEKMKNFKFDMSKGPKLNMELIPPPRFTHLSTPFNYAYRQNPAVKRTVDAFGNVTTFNTQLANKVLTQLVTYDVESVPMGPTNDLEPSDTLEPLMQDLIQLLRQLLEERPIWTRRAINNRLISPGREWSNVAKHIYQYAGYMFRSGPWRDAIVKFGVDPRSDPKYRIYQTMLYQIDDKEVEDLELSHLGVRKPGRKTKNRLSHLFDGKTAALDGKVWQVCDVLDPQLKSLLDTDNLRDKCHIESFGWYHNGTWAKARVIMKAKMAKILAGDGVPNDSDYEKIAALPEIIDKDTKHLAILSTNKTATSREVQWATDVRTIACVGWKIHRPKEDGEGKQSRSELGIRDGVVNEGTAIDPRLAETIVQEGEKSGLLQGDHDAAIDDVGMEMDDDGMVGFGDSDEDMEGDSLAEEDED